MNPFKFETLRRCFRYPHTLIMAIKKPKNPYKSAAEEILFHCRAKAAIIKSILQGRLLNYERFGVLSR
jgi:hypothetical protein